MAGKQEILKLIEEETTILPAPAKWLRVARVQCKRLMTIICHVLPVGKSEEEYEKFRVIQDREFESDFDKEVKKVGGSKKRKEENKT